jgi:hypothetical protein
MLKPRTLMRTHTAHKNRLGHATAERERATEPERERKRLGHTTAERERENDVDNNSDDGDNDGNDDDDGNIDDDDDDNDDDVDDIDDSHDSHDDDDDDDDNHTRRAALHCCRLHTTDTHDDKHAEWPSSAFIGSVGIDWSSWGGAEAVPAATRTHQ